MKTPLSILLVLLMSGCASQGQDSRYVNYGQAKAERVRIPACNPFHADELMDWATELESRPYHQRSARTSVDSQGWVRCSSREAAGSRFRGR